MEMFMREFISYTDKILDPGNIWLLEQEFGELREESSYLELSCELGKRPENRRKNRYRDILPYDDTRVILPLLPNDPESDYINANLVRGATGQHYSYIAAQGPLRHTLGDFWRMLYHFNVDVIVMLCNERESDKPKCERYWPNVSERPLRIDVFDVNPWDDSEYLNIMSRESGSESSWTPKDNASDQEAANGTLEQPPEVCVEMHFELELLSEEDALDSYYIRTIQATKFETILTWADEEVEAETSAASGPVNGEQKAPSTESPADKPADETVNPVDKTNESEKEKEKEKEEKEKEKQEKDGEDEKKQPEGSNATEESAEKSDTAQNEANQQERLYENVTPKKRRVAKREIRTDLREFRQYHYRNWADYAAADELDSILTMHLALRSFQPSVMRPICVHCSAGCGRTGTVLFIDFVTTLVNRGLLGRYLLRRRKTWPRTGADRPSVIGEDLVEQLQQGAAESDDDRTHTVVPRLRLDDSDTDGDNESDAGTVADEYDYERSAHEFVRSIVMEFRRQRPASVQSFEQFVMCYRATCEIFRKQLELVDSHQYVNLEELRTARRKSPLTTIAAECNDTKVVCDSVSTSDAPPIFTETVTISLASKLTDYRSAPQTGGLQSEQLAAKSTTTQLENDAINSLARASISGTNKLTRSLTPDRNWTGSHCNDSSDSVQRRRESKDDFYLLKSRQARAKDDSKDAKFPMKR